MSSFSSKIIPSLWIQQTLCLSDHLRASPTTFVPLRQPSCPSDDLRAYPTTSVTLRYCIPPSFADPSSTSSHRTTDKLRSQPRILPHKHHHLPLRSPGQSPDPHCRPLPSLPASTTRPGPAFAACQSMSNPSFRAPHSAILLDLLAALIVICTTALSHTIKAKISDALPVLPPFSQTMKSFSLPLPQLLKSSPNCPSFLSVSF
ncbi:hypothetical protein PTTG_10161 [Puccinia triticina 1-1 BBBD Race 1]|uniref:Uncharacterized protein n=1 Tax=Puccinia triticina (isolate 1-1 / race 1 (BBBD)) TaxID=630390 RepID=A0A0C4FAC0_PUCT1|nr:hypothetical protein PTTG_10161 [Puccinia triticina 1-1 BBBD Race 1]